MSIKPVWIILTAQKDLVKLAGHHLVDQFPNYAIQPNSDTFGLVKNNRAQLFLRGGGSENDSLDEYEPQERAQLKEWNLTRFSHAVESRDPSLTIDLIERLSKLTDLAIFDDMGLLLRAEEFKALKPEQQVSFLIGNGI
ncbi:hypothetical protein J7443_24755 [Tropicibacter sp. R15_0]|uniref:hypothetical protein n=1 Tax=Tropicibacter sp. R15_0 TaxID=2821101 RepID=UPI001ADA7B86|nr:hypothetical protein [Tropicibacter sp. R15_0]MBO9468457.1 hypothetical protein [Tropicibacter sp. R15_0]